VDYWYNLDGVVRSPPVLKGTEPFVAVYSAGDCVVANVTQVPG